MSSRRRRPSPASLIAWLGVVGTVLGILGFFVSDLPGLLGNGEPQPGVDLPATLVALEREKLRAEFELTQIALANQQAANIATQEAIATQGAIVQGTLDAVQAEQEGLAATSNALAALTATADAADAEGTRIAQNATATANFLAQLPPTNTPVPTSTAVPDVVADHRSIEVADVRGVDGRLVFAARVAQPIPETPQEGLAYVWALDTDRDPATGAELEDIGVDARVAIQFAEGAWVGTVGVVKPDGTPGNEFLFFQIEISGNNVVGTVSPAEVALPGAFDWSARVEQGGRVYSPFPESGHLSL